jgi:hypothetical protein
LLYPNFTFHPCVHQYPIVSHLGLVGLQCRGRSCLGHCLVGGLPSFNLAMAAVRLVIILQVAGLSQPACQWCCSFEWMHLPNCRVILPSSPPGQFLGSSLIGQGQVARGHAVDVPHLSKCGHPADLPLVPPVIREGTASPLSPCESHFPTVERMFGPSRDHHFLRDGYSSVLSKCLAFLLLACVDGKGKFGMNSLVEIGGIVVEIRLAVLVLLRVRNSTGTPECTSRDVQVAMYKS